MDARRTAPYNPTCGPSEADIELFIQSSSLPCYCADLLASVGVLLKGTIFYECSKPSCARLAETIAVEPSTRPPNSTEAISLVPNLVNARCSRATSTPATFNCSRFRESSSCSVMELGGDGLRIGVGKRDGLPVMDATLNEYPWTRLTRQMCLHWVRWRSWSAQVHAVNVSSFSSSEVETT